VWGSEGTPAGAGTAAGYSNRPDRSSPQGTSTEVCLSQCTRAGARTVATIAHSLTGAAEAAKSSTVIELPLALTWSIGKAADRPADTDVDR
jgi:hypothetical protein